MPMSVTSMPAICAFAPRISASSSPVAVESTCTSGARAGAVVKTHRPSGENRGPAPVRAKCFDHNSCPVSKSVTAYCPWKPRVARYLPSGETSRARAASRRAPKVCSVAPVWRSSSTHGPSTSPQNSRLVGSKCAPTTLISDRCHRQVVVVALDQALMRPLIGGFCKKGIRFRTCGVTRRVAGRIRRFTGWRLALLPKRRTRAGESG